MLGHRILEIGPQFTLLGQIDANFGLQNVNAAVEVNYDLGGASFAFPPQAGSNTDGITSTSKREVKFYFCSSLTLPAALPMSVQLT